MQNKDWGKTYTDYEKTGEFSKEQLHEIQLAYDIDLNPRQVYLLARAELSVRQMEIIREGFKQGFAYVQLKGLAKPNLSMEEMDLIMKDNVEFMESQKNVLF